MASNYHRRVKFGFLAAVMAVYPALGSGALDVGGAHDARALRSIAFEHYLDKNIDVAFDFYDQALAAAIKEYGHDSTYVGDLYYEVGTLALQKSKFNKAEECLRAAVKQNPNSVMAHVKLAELLQVRERPDLAFEQIQAALSKDPKSPEARRALIVWLLGRKNSAAAIRESYLLAQSTSTEHPAKTDEISKLAEKTAETDEEAKPEKADEPKEEKKTVATLPVLPFLRGVMPKPAAPPPAKPPEKKSVAKPVRVQLRARPAVAPTKPKVQKHRDRLKQETARSAAPLIPPVPEELHAQAGVLKTTAKVKKQNVERSENETREQPAATAPAAMSLSAEPPVKHGKGSKSRTTLVPPPPPTYPGYIAPLQMIAPPPQVRPPAPKREKPKEAAPAEDKPANSSTAGSGGAGNTDDDYLLKWAGVKSKKKP